MKKSITSMADGRELIYYDTDESVIRDRADSRDFPDLATASEMRHDPLLDEWVVMASHRQTRTFLPPTDHCPLCPSTADNATEVPDSDYDIVVFENRFPSLTTTTVIDDEVAMPDLIARQPASGRCEVVVFTSDHHRAFSQLTVDRVRQIVDVWADRTAVLSKMPSTRQVFPFENRGVEIGVTLTHPHGQIYAFPFVTPKTVRMLDSARRHFAATGTNLFAALLSAEQQAGIRVIDRNDTWTAFVPATARWPIDIHIYPNRRVADLTELTGDERDGFARIYLPILQRLDMLYAGPLPYIAAWHQAPVAQDRDLAYLHLELFSIRRAVDKLKYLAGTESGMGVWINDATPEQIAQMIRDVEL